MIVEAALLEELIMHSVVMVTISGGIVVKRKYVKGYKPNFSKLRVTRRKIKKSEARHDA